MNSGLKYASLPLAFKFNFVLLADVNLSNLNVLTWRENYAGSSGLPSVKLSSDLLNSRISDGAMVRKESIITELLRLLLGVEDTVTSQ